MCFELTCGWGRVGPRRVGPEGWGAQNFALFFPVPPQNSFFSFLSGGLLVEFWWCLKCRGAQMCTFGVLGLSCASPGGPVWWGRRVLKHQNWPKSTRRHPEREEKNEFCGQEREKKERNFGRSRGGRSRGGRSRGGRSREGRSREGRSREHRT